MFTAIPSERPNTPLLDSIDTPSDVRALSRAALPELCEQLRAFLLYSVGQSGGHFGAGLGVVELTVALHYVFDTPNDALIWDVGHQAYPHKILTGRREDMVHIRAHDGPAPFPTREESPFDAFGVGHSSTSISAALGMALAHLQQGVSHQAVAVIGDGAMSAGMAFEALNHAGDEQANVLVVLNDNDMSISKNVGGLNHYIRGLWPSFFAQGTHRWMPKLQKTAQHFRRLFSSGTLFEQLGFSYKGPVDGHDVIALVQVLERIKKRQGPRFLHVVTCKGKGFAPAERDQVKYHALSSNKPNQTTYSAIFGAWLCEQAARDVRLTAITPAMAEGSGMVEFSQRFPERFFDVAIAEQHALTLASGMACEGSKPVVAIYSTFLQRAYDQLIHDIALQNLDVLIAIDRAGLVGEDGPTHHGAYDLSFLRAVPNMVIIAPSDGECCRQALTWGYEHSGPVAVRYPRGTACELNLPPTPFELGRGVLVRSAQNAKRVAIVSFGALLPEALEAGEALDATVVDMRFVKPLDDQLLAELAREHELLVTLEDNAVCAGAGSAVLESLSQQGLRVQTLLLGIDDAFIPHASQRAQLKRCGLDANAIITRIHQTLGQAS